MKEKAGPKGGGLNRLKFRIKNMLQGRRPETSEELEALDRALLSQATPAEIRGGQILSAQVFLDTALKNEDMNDARFWSFVKAELEKGRDNDEVIEEAQRLYPSKKKGKK